MADSENTRTLPVARRQMLASSGLFAAAAAALQAAPTVEAARAFTPSASPDALVLEIAAAVQAAQAKQDDLAARYTGRGLPYGHPEVEIYERGLEEASDAMQDALETLAGLPACTLAGLRAKAEALRIACRNYAFKELTTPDEEQGYPHERMAWSLANDLLAVTGARLAGRA